MKPADPAIRCTGLTRRWGRTLAVDSLDLDVPEGAIYGLIGPNGAGKSTTFAMLCGWIRPDAGHARVLGLPADQAWRLRGQVAALPQDAQLPAHSTLLQLFTGWAEGMGMRPGAARDEAERVLVAVDLQESRQRRSRELSHGMHRRAGLAQALLGQPRVLLLDEPTSGIDPVNAVRIKEIIAGLQGRATVVVSSHNMAEVQQVCTHGAILHRGRCMAHGTMHDLTHQGARVVVETGSCPPSLERSLIDAFGDGNVTLREGTAGRSLIEVRFGEGDAAPRVHARLLSLLLHHKADVWGMQAGTSLERALVEMMQPPAG
jgi:ABC-type multidrug transport system ATPase subunit